MSHHKAAIFPAQGKPAEVADVPTKSPGRGEVLVKNHAIAIAPVDHYIRDFGFLVKSWPTIAGFDIAGEVVEVGPDVSNVKKGDRVLAHPNILASGKTEYSGFQEYTIVPYLAVAKIPDKLSFVDAVVLPLAVATAIAGMYPKDFLGLDLPSTSPKPNGQKLLVWGASSTVGASTIQLAVASGYEVIATASEKNFGLAKSLGASKVFDYKSLSVVGDLTAELQNGKCAGAYDAIGTQDTQLAIATILAQLGGGKIASVLPVPEEGIPSTVDSKQCEAWESFGKYSDLGQAVFQDFLPQALASGQVVPQPEAEVFGTGLESIQGAIEKHRKGVSAKKIVVTL